MTRPDKDKEREEHISQEITVDAYGPEEQAISWYYYLADKLAVPFTARCIVERPTSPLKIGEKVEVVGMPSEEVCEHEMFVLIQWQSRQLAVPLMQLEGLQINQETEQAMEDWRYWMDRGYQL